MFDATARDVTPIPPQKGRGRFEATVVTSLLALLVASLSAVALASAGTSPIVSSASNATLGKSVLVDSHGRTLYELKPETAHHLLCKSRECLEVWMPVTVRSSTTKLIAGSGVHGHLGTLRRSKKSFQVTLGGLPLYRFAGDSAAGEANGQGVKSFGGTWHVVVTATTAPGSTPTTTTPSAPTPLPGY